MTRSSPWSPPLAPLILSSSRFSFAAITGTRRAFARFFRPAEISETSWTLFSLRFLAVPTAQSFHGVSAEEDGIVTRFGTISDTDFCVNAGFFCLRREVFDYIEEGDELVEKPFQRMIAVRKLAAYRYRGFWQQMDTLKDKMLYDQMESRGDCRWMVWKR